MRMHVGGVHGLLDGFARFHQEHYNNDTRLYRELSSQGQHPKIMVISCSDSRVDPSILFDASAGDMFVVRNVANLVPPYQPDDGSYHGTSAALEFAVRHLNVEHVVVLGHSGCAGVRRLVEKEADNNNDEYSFVDSWVGIANEALKTSSHMDDKDACSECERTSISVSLDNLETFPWVKERIDNNTLQLHGWYFSLDSGQLEVWNENQNSFTAA